jgi:hypothetical protein
MEERLEKLEGKLPLIALVDKSSFWSIVSSPSSLGMVPVIWLLLREISSRKPNLLRELGIVPEMRLWSRVKNLRW